MRINEFLNIFKLRGKQKDTALSNKTKYDLIEDVTDVFAGYNYYVNYLYEKLIRIFKYDNLPNTIPRDALENYILTFGYAGITKTRIDESSDEILVAVPCTKYGVGLYPNYEPLAQYCTPLIQGTDLVVGSDIVVVKNNSYQISCDNIVKRYARQLADFDATVNILTSNARIPVLPSFDNEESAESYKAVMVANRLGQVDTVLDKSFIQKGTFTPYADNSTISKIEDVVKARNEILRTFLSEIGITTANDKRERMVVDEVNVNSQMLLFNVADMLECRQNAIKEVNALYGTTIKVDLSDEYAFIKEETTATVKEGDNNESES